jgi:predicted nucleic acid-binding protein
MEGIVIDTNVFVAAGFNPKSASARVLADIRRGRFLLIWNKPTQRETEVILRRIPRLDWERVADLFRPEGEFIGPVDSDAFALVRDPDDRKFAALSAAAKRPLITNDKHLLAGLNIIGIDVLTPRAFLARDPWRDHDLAKTAAAREMSVGYLVIIARSEVSSCAKGKMQLVCPPTFF